MYKNIEVEKKGKIAYVKLNRPSKLNSMNLEMLEELDNAFRDIKENEKIIALIISGRGIKGMSSGADINYLRSLSPTEFSNFNNYACSILTYLEEMGKISIAAMHGYTVAGGCELASACTLRVAEAGTLIGQSEINIAGVAGWGGTTRLPRLIGFGKAAELLLTGKLISAEQAVEIGLVNKIAEAGKLIETAETLANEVIHKSPLALALNIEAIYQGYEMNKRDSLKIGAKNSALMSSTEDFIEGTDAVLQKREPMFKGY